MQSPVPAALFLALVLAAGLPGAWGADPAVGQRLHDTHCVTCHDSLMQGEAARMYTRARRRVQSYPALVAQVHRCEGALGLHWSDAEVENVAAWLNQRYYRF